MRRRIIIAAVIVSLILCLTGGYFVYQRYFKPATPVAVCTRFFQLSKQEYEKETGAKLSKEQVEDLLQLTKADCEREEARRREQSTANFYEQARLTRCQIEADDIETFINCDER